MVAHADLLRPGETVPRALARLGTAGSPPGREPQGDAHPEGPSVLAELQEQNVGVKVRLLSYYILQGPGSPRVWGQRYDRAVRSEQQSDHALALL